MASHKKAVEAWNDLMVKTGIRQYCQEICKGKCCKPVLKGCGKDCHNSLPCVAYTCGKIQYEMQKQLGSDHTTEFGYLSCKISNKARKINEYRYVWGYAFNNTKNWPLPLKEFYQFKMTLNHPWIEYDNEE